MRVAYFGKRSYLRYAYLSELSCIASESAKDFHTIMFVKRTFGEKEHQRKLTVESFQNPIDNLGRIDETSHDNSREEIPLVKKFSRFLLCHIRQRRTLQMCNIVRFAI